MDVHFPIKNNNTINVHPISESSIINNKYYINHKYTDDRKLYMKKKLSITDE